VRDLHLATAVLNMAGVARQQTTVVLRAILALVLATRALDAVTTDCCSIVWRGGKIWLDS
jgi:hypothetical protein